jgi:hypothetical protein
LGGFSPRVTSCGLCVGDVVVVGGCVACWLGVPLLPCCMLYTPCGRPWCRRARGMEWSRSIRRGSSIMPVQLGLIRSGHMVPSAWGSRRLRCFWWSAPSPLAVVLPGIPCTPLVRSRH